MGRTAALVVFLGLSQAVSVASAKPIIKADVRMHDVGTIVQGEKDAVTYTFRLKNTGDEVLTIKKVRPG